MFTLDEIESMISKMGSGYNNSFQQSATRKLVMIKEIMLDSGIKEIKIII